jgi:hypothetical protein
MSLLNQVTTAPDSRGADGGYPPVRINLQGIDGIGKSTFGSDADGSIFIQAEDGLGFIKNVSSIPCSKYMGRDQGSDCKALMNEDHQVQDSCA